MQATSAAMPLISLPMLQILAAMLPTSLPMPPTSTVWKGTMLPIRQSQPLKVVWIQLRVPLAATLRISAATLPTSAATAVR